MHRKQQNIKNIYGKEPETLDEIGEACIAVISKESVPVVGFAWTITHKKKVSNSHSAPLDGYSNWGGRDTRGPIRGYPGFEGRVWIRYATNPDFSSMSGCFNSTLTHTGTGGSGSYNGLWSLIATAEYNTRKQPTDRRLNIIHAYPPVRSYSFDYRFFQSDFPMLCVDPTILLAVEYKAFEKEQDDLELWNKLQGNYFTRAIFDFQHHFEWEDPTTKAADDEFIQEWQDPLKCEAVSS